MPWSSPLSWPVILRDGETLRTLLDAAERLTSLSHDRQKHDWVGHAAGLLMEASKSAGKIEDATRQVERALKREGLMR